MNDIVVSCKNHRRTSDLSQFRPQTVQMAIGCRKLNRNPWTGHSHGATFSYWLKVSGTTHTSTAMHAVSSTALRCVSNTLIGELVCENINVTLWYYALHSVKVYCNIVTVIRGRTNCYVWFNYTFTPIDVKVWRQWQILERFFKIFSSLEGLDFYSCPGSIGYVKRFTEKYTDRFFF